MRMNQSVPNPGATTAGKQARAEEMLDHASRIANGCKLLKRGYLFCASSRKHHDANKANAFYDNYYS